MLSMAVEDALDLRVGNDTVPIRLWVGNSESNCCLLLQFSK